MSRTRIGSATLKVFAESSNKIGAFRQSIRNFGSRALARINPFNYEFKFNSRILGYNGGGLDIKFKPNIKGDLTGASNLQSRAAELQAMRSDYLAGNGTTSAMKLRNVKTGEVRTKIAVENEFMPDEFTGKLKNSEDFAEGIDRAEQTIITSVLDKNYPTKETKSLKLKLGSFSFQQYAIKPDATLPKKFHSGGKLFRSKYLRRQNAFTNFELNFDFDQTF